MRPLLIVTLLVSPLMAAEPDLKPVDTYAVVAGVLQWPPSSRLAGFPTKHRKDEELVEVLKKRGVPAANIGVVLDDKATYSGIKSLIKDTAAKAPKGSTLIVYFCGHGFPVPGSGELCLANYDVVPQNAKLMGLLATDLAAMVKDNFKGQRVLFVADCCFSGGLGQSAAILQKAGYDAAAITSSAANISTVNWTFTQTLIDALNGDPFADADGNGLITLAELSGEVKAAMRALERQESGEAFHGLKPGFTISVGKPNNATGGAIKAGRYMYVPEAKRAGRVLSGADGKSVVQFYNYTEKVKVELPDSKLAALPDDWVRRKPPEAATHEVEWKGVWFPAVVRKTEGEKTLIHYIDFDDSWDEWVTKDRLRVKK